MNSSTALAMAACLIICGNTFGDDSIRLSDGKTMSGKITGMTSQQVAVKSRGKTKSVPVNEIVSISFDGAPAALKLAKLSALNGRYEDALKTLGKIKPGEIKRDLIKQEVAFYKAMCAARLALAGSGEIQAAGQQMIGFVRSHPKNYHWLKANALVGDLLVARKSFSHAADYYDKMAKSPWPDYRMRAMVAIGQAKLAEGKTQEARKAFDDVLATKTPGKAAETQKLYARLGKARCLAEEKKTDEADKLVQEIILAANPEDSRLMAKAYNVLGTSLRKAGKPNDALLAFLHVDILYSSVPEEHAEALANLAELWNEVHKPQKAVEARQLLERRYKNSRWTTR
jgi:tetratricopeptide (TPR) repeat protein